MHVLIILGWWNKHEKFFQYPYQILVIWGTPGSLSNLCWHYIEPVDFYSSRYLKEITVNICGICFWDMSR